MNDFLTVYLIITVMLSVLAIIFELGGDLDLETSLTYEWSPATVLAWLLFITLTPALAILFIIIYSIYGVGSLIKALCPNKSTTKRQ